MLSNFHQIHLKPGNNDQNIQALLKKLFSDSNGNNTKEDLELIDLIKQSTTINELINIGNSEPLQKRNQMQILGNKIDVTVLILRTDKERTAVAKLKML